jgi:hypothetical protein
MAEAWEMWRSTRPALNAPLEAALTRALVAAGHPPELASTLAYLEGLAFHLRTEESAARAPWRKRLEGRAAAQAEAARDSLAAYLDGLP